MRVHTIFETYSQKVLNKPITQMDGQPITKREQERRGERRMERAGKEKIIKEK